LINWVVRFAAPIVLTPVILVFIGKIAGEYVAKLISKILGDHRSVRVRIRRAPGAALISVALWLIPKKDVERILGQAIADMREEYFEALAEGRRWKARWIRVRGMLGICLAVVQRMWHRIGKFLLGFTKLVS